MKTLKILIFLFLISKSTLAQQESDYSFSLLRQNDNIDFFKNNESKNTYQKFKYIPIGEKSMLSFGSSWRFQTESFINEQFQNVPDQDNLWFLNRILLHAHLKVNDKFQIFAELNSSLASAKDDPSPVDKDELSVNQLFVSYQLFPKWSFDIGRQNMKLGSGRLVDVREGPNVRNSFDLAQIKYDRNKFSAKAFFSVPVKQMPYSFDNQFLDFNETFSALHTTTTINKSDVLDTYLFYQKDNNVIYNNIQGNERRTSIGMRYFGKYRSLTFNNEVVYQFGNIESQDIHAWTLSIHAEKQSKLGNQLYNIGVKAEAISGDKDENDNTLNTFDALYPRGAYFGRVARFGPSNLIDLHPFINTQIKKLFIELDYDAFWRYSINDGVYNAGLLLEFPNTNDERFIGQQIGTVIGYSLKKNISIEFENNIIFPGEFLKQSNQGDTLYHFVVTTEIKF